MLLEWQPIRWYSLFSKCGSHFFSRLLVCISSCIFLNMYDLLYLSSNFCIHWYRPIEWYSLFLKCGSHFFSQLLVCISSCTFLNMYDLVPALFELQFLHSLILTYWMIFIIFKRHKPFFFFEFMFHKIKIKNYFNFSCILIDKFFRNMYNQLYMNSNVASLLVNLLNNTHYFRKAKILFVLYVRKQPCSMIDVL